MHHALLDDGLPPLREVVRAHGIEPAKALGQNFLFDLNLTGRIARAGWSADGCQCLGDRPRARRVDPRPAGRGRPGYGCRTRPPLPRGAGRNRGPLSGPADGDRRRRPEAAARTTAARLDGRALAHRREPSLQRRDRTADPLGGSRALAALVRPHGPHVPARGGRAHRRDPGRAGRLWPAGGALRLADAGPDPVRHIALPPLCRRPR